MPEQMIRIPRSIGPLKIRPQSDEPTDRGIWGIRLWWNQLASEIDTTPAPPRGPPELLTEFPLILCRLFPLQMEIAKRLNGIIAQLLPFLSQEV